MNISELSIRRPVLATVLTIIILLFGLIGYGSLGVREYPSVDNPIISVSCSYPGANADVIENQITEPLEQNINGIPGIRSLSSTSRQGQSRITVEFELSVDLETAANDVRDKVSRAQRYLPRDCDPPTVSKADADATPILMVTIQSDKRSLLELSEIAEKRLSAIREFAEFNSGFRIAMRDLEIRGAGSLLGAEQSGHMIDVGYDMYLKLLEEAVLEERGEKPEQRAECAADLAVSANIPESYVPSQEQRMDLYRRIALVRSEPEADDLMDEVIDRFGDPPPSVYTLVQVALLRSDAGKVGVTDISQKNGCLKFLLAEFDMQKVSLLYARPEFKGRLKVDAGAKPGVILRLKSRDHVIEQARAFVSAWADAREERA